MLPVSRCLPHLQFAFPGWQKRRPRRLRQRPRPRRRSRRRLQSTSRRPSCVRRPQWGRGRPPTARRAGAGASSGATACGSAHSRSGALRSGSCFGCGCPAASSPTASRRARLAGSPHSTCAMQRGFFAHLALTLGLQTTAHMVYLCAPEDHGRSTGRALWRRGRPSLRGWRAAQLTGLPAWSAGHDFGARVCAQGGPGCLAAGGPRAPGCGSQISPAHG